MGNCSNHQVSPLLSVVIPVYDEAEALPLLRERLDRVLSQLCVRSEVILIDDGSRDKSGEIMRDFARTDDRYKALILSRNYGHQVALTAGLEHALGDVVVVLDADLQDPPELIQDMLDKWDEGYDVVYGERRSRQGESFAKRFAADLFYRVMAHLSGVDIPKNVGDFRLMDRKVLRALKQMPERFRFVRGMVTWTGFRQTSIVFDRSPRAAGSTKYTWTNMFSFALDGILSFSVIPLRLATFIGLAVSLLAVLEILRTLYLRFVLEATVPGFSAILVTILALGGLNLVFMGILGEYIGRIYVEAKRRPLYLIQEFVSNVSRKP